MMACRLVLCGSSVYVHRKLLGSSDVALTSFDGVTGAAGTSSFNRITDGFRDFTVVVVVADEDMLE